MVSPSLYCSIVFFFSSLARCTYWSYFSLSFSFTQWSAGTAKSTVSQVLFFLLTISRSGRLANIRWSVWISISFSFLRGLHASVSWWSSTEVWVSPQASSSLQNSSQYPGLSVAWMVSTRPLISECSNLSSNLLVTEPNAPITIGISVTFMFLEFFSVL